MEVGLVGQDTIWFSTRKFESTQKTGSGWFGRCAVNLGTTAVPTPLCNGAFSCGRFAFRFDVGLLFRAEVGCTEIVD